MTGLSLVTCHYVKHGMDCTPGVEFIVYWLILIVLIYMAAFSARR